MPASNLVVDEPGVIPFGNKVVDVVVRALVGSPSTNPYGLR
jgi:hypothetical protein